MNYFQQGITLIVLLLLWLPVAAMPQNFQANYKAKYGSFSVSATRELQTLDDGSKRISFKAKSWLAQIKEYSHFTWNEKGQLRPLRYEYSRTGLGKNKHKILDFDWANQSLSNSYKGKQWTSPLPEVMLDKLSYQMQLRHDLLNKNNDQASETEGFSYTVADAGTIKNYRFNIVQEEKLQTKLGFLNTVKVKRVRDKDADRTTHIWLAKDWDYIIIRILQEEDGDQYEINLVNATVDGKQVQGLKNL